MEDEELTLDAYLETLENGDAADLLVLELWNKHFTSDRGFDNVTDNWYDEDAIAFLGEVQKTVRAAMSL